MATRGSIARVTRLPECDFCSTAVGEIKRPARYDFRTTFGPWANACVDHYMLHRRSTVLGTGHGQLLVLVSEDEGGVEAAQARERRRLRKMGRANVP